MALVLLAVVNAGPGEQMTDSAARLRALHEARAAAELAEADRLCPGSDVVASAGDLLADVVLLKGLPGPAEASGGRALEGADGEAAGKALAALGWSPERTFRALSSPSNGLDAGRRARRVRLIVEAIDPRVVIALDQRAAEDLARAYEIAPLDPGVEVITVGRRLLAVSGLEDSLGDEARKKAVWRQLKAAAPRGPSY